MNAHDDATGSRKGNYTRLPHCARRLRGSNRFLIRLFGHRPLFYATKLDGESARVCFSDARKVARLNNNKDALWQHHTVIFTTRVFD